MPKIRKYIPAFVSGVKPETVKFETMNELINIPFVKKCVFEGFSGFAISGDSLMAVYNNNDKYYVVGFIDDPSIIELPIWKQGIEYDKLKMRKKRKVPYKKSKGCWELRLYLKCPYCGRYIDDTVQVDDGKEYRGNVECVYCGKTFIAEVKSFYQ